MSTVKSYEQLRDEYRLKKQSEQAARSALVRFVGFEGEKDAYNPSGPFHVGDEVYQWARIETRTMQDAVSMLFKQIDPQTFELVPDAPVLPVEDPFTAQIGDQIVVGGVQITKDIHDRVIAYKTLFYRGASFALLAPFSEGPEDMKDIRLVECPRDDASTVFTFTRPYIPIESRMVGRVAATTFNSLDELVAERLAVEHTALLPDIFIDTEWGGVNDAYVLPNGLVGALGHVSKFDDRGGRHYAAIVFVVDTATLHISPPEMIAEREDFPLGPIKVMPENLGVPDKHEDLADVIFPSRLRPIEGDMLSAQTLELTAGLSDAAAGTLLISNPFPSHVYHLTGLVPRA